MENQDAKSDRNEPEEIYVLPRDSGEVVRLHFQHGLIKRVTRNNFVDPEIPLATLLNIADIATGTAIWLEELAASLNESPTDPPRKYTGFDISAALFPATIPAHTNFVVHNILDPFPTTFHAQFDLVHIRLLSMALQKPQYKVALTNVLPLLKPGGYLQWEEFETANHKYNPSSAFTDHVARILHHFMDANELSITPCAEVVRGLEELGVEDVRVVDFAKNVGEDMMEDVRKWHKNSVRAAMFPCLLKDGEGRSVEEAKAMADGIVEEFEKVVEEVVPEVPFMRVVARKRGGGE